MRLTCDERAMLDPHGFSLLERRCLVISEIARTSVLHPHADLVNSCAAQMFFDGVAGKTATHGPQRGHAQAASSSAELVADQAAGNGTADRAEARAAALMAHGRNRFDRSAACARCSRALLRRRVGLLGLLRRVRRLRVALLLGVLLRLSVGLLSVLRLWLWLRLLRIGALSRRLGGRLAGADR